MGSIQTEKEFLESVAQTYVTSESSQDRLIKTLAVRTFTPYLKTGGMALEYGCCDGFMTSLISQYVAELTVIDGSQTFIDLAKARVPPSVKFINSLFEDFSPERKFDYIFATYVLEHVENPVDFLKIAADLLTADGYLFIVVPNARAFSRQLARHMGLIDDLYSLTQNDINHGHRRVYDRVILNRDINSAGLQIVSQGGLLFKLLADFQMDEMIDKAILNEPQQDGLYKMGLEYPELAGSLFAVCKRI